MLWRVHGILTNPGLCKLRSNLMYRDLKVVDSLVERAAVPYSYTGKRITASSAIEKHLVYHYYEHMLPLLCAHAAPDNTPPLDLDQDTLLFMAKRIYYGRRIAEQHFQGSKKLFLKLCKRKAVEKVRQELRCEWHDAKVLQAVLKQSKSEKIAQIYDTVLLPASLELQVQHIFERAGCPGHYHQKSDSSARKECL